MKKRGFASLFIVSVIAIAAVAGVVFAFLNFGRPKDVYGSATMSADKSNINLEIELEKDPEADNNFQIKETSLSWTYVTIKVGGLPSTADHRAILDAGSAGGVVSVEAVTSAAEAGKTGVNVFKITGKNGGKTALVFTNGSQSVTVNVTVSMLAKDMKIASTAHFGIRQGGAALDLNSADITGKFIFYAHPDDLGQTFRANKYPLEYRLSRNYRGITLENGLLTVSEQSNYVDQEIYLQVKLPDMTVWLDVPFYVFPSVNKIFVNSNAYRSETTAADDKVWDLIANRTRLSSANFTFALDYDTQYSDYGFIVTSMDEIMVHVDPKGRYNYTLTAPGQSLGTTAIKIMSYPIVKKSNGAEVYYSDASDANVQITDTIYIRVRNEFYNEADTETYGKKSFNLATNKDTIDAFYYEGNHGSYYDTFTLDTGNGSVVNMDSDVEFELLVKDKDGNVSTYGWNAANNPRAVSLYSILQIGYWSSAANNWVLLTGTPDGYHVNYLNRFSVSFMHTVNARDFISNSLTLTLRIKSVNKLSVGGYATCDIKLDVTSAIDNFKIENLTEFDDGALGIALVYNTLDHTFSEQTIYVHGMFAVANEPDDYSMYWNTAKVSDNVGDLPFTLKEYNRLDPFELDGVGGYYRIKYTISAPDDGIDAIEYYRDYPMTIKYANGISYTFYIRVYPTVEDLSMSVISNSKGKIYQTITEEDSLSGYEHVRTVYVRKGYDYQFAVNTPGVSVGAYAVFDEIDLHDRKVFGTTSFDARDLSEGLYECIVSLHAYSDAVYSDNNTVFKVYVIVVDPVGDVSLWPQPQVTLDGIGDYTTITVNMTTLDGEDITDFTYLRINEQSNENVTLEQGEGSDYNKFKITAKYLTKDVFTVGFRIYKHYEFPGYDLDGKDWVKDEPLEFYYIGGAYVTIKVKINDNKSDEIALSDIDHDNTLGDYLGVISKPAVETTEIGYATDATKYADYGIAFAQWKNGRYDVQPFVEVAANANLVVNGVLTAKLNSQTGKIEITPNANVNSMAEYALVVYTRDSLRYHGINGDKANLVFPDTYIILPLYIGSADEIENTIEDLAKNVVHDANSGKLNNWGGYNWIVAGHRADSQTTNSGVALLFYTQEPKEGNSTNESNIEANVYYLDDLYTVLRWSGLLPANTTSITITKYIDNVSVGQKSFNSSNERLALNLNLSYGDNDTAKYTTKINTVYYEISGMKFYVVEGLNPFEVSIESNSTNGVVSRVNLSSSTTKPVDVITMQRGDKRGFKFDSYFDRNSQWAMWSDFDTDEETRTTYDTYQGGTYSFYPYVELDDYRFDVDALTATIKVNIKGGVNYLNIAQDSISLDGVTTAVYDVTVRVDKDWRADLLTYKFKYDSIYYNLFEDNQYVSYVNMEGGKAKLEFKLTCLNANEATSTSSSVYKTYYLRIEVAIIIVAPDVDPFYDISGAYLIIEENLSEDSPLFKTKAPLNDSAEFNLTKRGIYNVTMAHFANTNAVKDNKSALTVTSGQSDEGIIYLDNGTLGGLLVVYPTPYYINVSNIELFTSGTYVDNDNIIGTTLEGEPIRDPVTYSIGFTQMIYNEQDKCYQPYLTGNGTPKMVSSWSPAAGYKWTGKYYFKTYIICDKQIARRLPENATFTIKIRIKGESNADYIEETMTLTAKYRDSFGIEPDDDTEDYAICTMSQTQYQALGTTATYDVALPTGCTPYYNNFTISDSTYLNNATIDFATNTLSVRLKADVNAIGSTIEIRIPYSRPGDYVNPYLSVVIVPVRFEFEVLEVINHYESVLQLYGTDRDDAINQLQYRANFKYDTSMTNYDLSEKMNTFNESLKTAASPLMTVYSQIPNEITVQLSYSYFNGVPVLTKNGTFRYEKTFYYNFYNTSAPATATIKRTEYLAVGTDATYTFKNWDSLSANKLYVLDATKNSADIQGLWDYEQIKYDPSTNNVSLVVSLKNNSADKHAAYAKLIGKSIVLNIYSGVNPDKPQVELTIIPVYFTFTEFKLQNNPVNPLVALSTPTVITIEAGNITAAEDSAVDNAIKTFNAELLAAQKNLASNATSLSFSRVPNDDNILNYNFDPATRAITRADSANPISATSYLLITAGITYVNGIPTLSSNGNRMATYIPVRTFGADAGNNGSTMPDLGTAPNGRTRTVAQAIGTTVRYNIALSGVAYDTRLDKYEMRTDGNYVREDNAGWDAIFDVKESIVAVTLDKNTDLFDKVLVMMAYSQEGKLMYVINIVPAYFTVEQILLAEHLDEVPVMIKSGNANWLNQLELDFAYSPLNRDFEFENFNNDAFKAARSELLDSLNHSGLVSRIDDAGYITLLAGVNYDGGVPRLVNMVNAVTTVQNTYRYVFIDGTPEMTRAQALNQEITYNVNRVVGDVKIATKGTDGKEIWQSYVHKTGDNWWINWDATTPKAIKVGLGESTDLFGKRIRIGVFANTADQEPSYILNIIPAYFTVEDLSLAGQSHEDRDIFLYYGDEIDTPDDVLFDGVFGPYSRATGLDVASKLRDFNGKLHSASANLIGRDYDRSLVSGDLRVTVYLDYTTGTPILVDSTEANNELVIRLDSGFNYTIYGQPAPDPDYPAMPSGPRTRTEVQAVGTTQSYTIDLGKTISMDLVDLTKVNFETEGNRGWNVTFEENVVTVELSTNADTLLSGNGKDEPQDIVLNFYHGYELVFVLTIQPVLFEVVGIETIYPEQPANLTGIELANVNYRAITKYNDAVKFGGDDVIKFIDSFNEQLNATKAKEKGLLQYEVVEAQSTKYLKVDIAVDYGTVGTLYRQVPALLNVDNYPLNVVESYIEFTTGVASNQTVATHYQAIGTTEYYYLGAEYNNLVGSTDAIKIAIDDPTKLDVDTYVTAKIMTYGNGTVLKVEVKANEKSLLNNKITITITNDSKTFTMTIKPVLFVVEGFDVIGHPERHLWMIMANSNSQKVADLSFTVRARYANNLGDELKKALQDGITAFNKQLIDNKNFLETYTIGGEYLVVRAAVEYGTDGLAKLVDIEAAKPTQVVRDVFKYVYYSDQVSGSGLAYPNIPRSRTEQVTVGTSATYTLDIPNLKSGFSDEMIALYENKYPEYAGNDAMLKPYENGSDGWTVKASGNTLTVTLDPQASLVNRELKVFIYKDRKYTGDFPNSYDAERVAFILTIQPVWFKVTGIALNGHPEDVIYVNDINDFMSELSAINEDGKGKFVPVYEYSDELLGQDEVGDTLQKLMSDFTSNFMYDSHVIKTRAREVTADGVAYHFQVTTSVSYVPFAGTAELTNEIADRIWQSFMVVEKGTADENTADRTVYQAIGTTKTYYIDKDISGDISTNDEDIKCAWNENNNHYLTVTMPDTAKHDQPYTITIGDKFTMTINPVYYEIMGFEPVEHPERAAWVISPYTIEDLQYRVITNDLTGLPAEILPTVQQAIAKMNTSLNDLMNRAPIEITVESNQYIIIDAAVDYVEGYPVIKEIGKDKRNVVESIIPYRVWSSTQKPKPEHPTTVGTTAANQLIGSTKLYTLKNIHGQVFYQYLWVENAGSMMTSFENSLAGNLQTYEGLSILVDSAKGTLQIQLAATDKYLSDTIRIYLPYLTTVNGNDVWYSYCIEITPLLFELKGWTIAGVNTNQLVQHELYDDFLLLKKGSDTLTQFRYVPRINYIESVLNDSALSIKAANAYEELQRNAVNYITPIVSSDNIGFENLNLRRNIDPNDYSENYVVLSSYIEYKDGIPQLVNSSKTLISNQILIVTGYDDDDWAGAERPELSSGVNYAVQAIGTSNVYMVEVPAAAKIFYDKIKVVDQTTGKTVAIEGEQANLVTWKHEATTADNMVMITVDLAPVLALRGINVEILIPYAENADATEPEYNYSYYITPVLYIVEGFYLKAAENNYLDLTDREVALELRARTYYSDDVVVRNMVNLMLQNFETSVNNAIRNETLTFDVINAEGGINVRLQSYGNTVWIQKIGDVTALNYINGAIQIGYSNGVPQLGSVNPVIDSLVNVRVQVHTQQGETSYFPGWDHVELGHTSQFFQAIGTSRNYPIMVTNNPNVVFYYEYIEIFNGGLKRGENEYEFFAYNVVNPGRQNLTLGFTLRASAKNLNDWIDIRIPYSDIVEGKTVWGYYLLQIKPVLFEIKSWKLKVGNELVDTITLDDSAIELWFSPEIVSGPLDQTYYSADELIYIKNAISRLEREINTYDPKISDGYTYMVINSVANEGEQINYTIYREDSTNTSYLLRDVGESSTTVMQLSANIAYGVSDFSKDYVEGAQAVTAYNNTVDAQRIMGQITIYTTDKSVADSSGDRSTVFITQANAARLMALSSGIDYILMSDIDLSQIAELQDGPNGGRLWKPAEFPSNTTLDGNNFKIYFNNNLGFDLSDQPTNIGLFSTISNNAVVKNLQLVFESGTPSAPYTTLKVDLSDYGTSSVNIGMLAGTNSGIITNCAVLTQWQFDMQNLTQIVNPITGNRFEKALPFNKDGYVFDDNYFYEIGLDEDGEPMIINVYNHLGYGLTKDENTGKYTDEVVYDIYMNVANWITPDRTNVARYEGYSPLIINEDNPAESKSPAKFYVYAEKNPNLNITMGGLVGVNTYMITNSRVLVDVELYGPEHVSDSTNIDLVNVMSSIVGGVVGINTGTITSSYFRDASVINNANANVAENFASLLGGFVGRNDGIVQQCYAMGNSTNREEQPNFISTAGAVKTIRNSLGGFVHVNNGTITDCLVNMVVVKTGTEGKAAGFVYQNAASGKISNCVENNKLVLGGLASDYYAAFVYINGKEYTGKVVTTNLSNLIYAGNLGSLSNSADWKGTLTYLADKRFSSGSGNNSNGKYFDDINNYKGFSIGQTGNDDWGVTADNTIWMMTDIGPMLREANEIAVSHRKYSWNSSPYLYNPGTAKNPYLIWNADQFNDYVYAATAEATADDRGAGIKALDNIENHRQNNHLRLVDNVLLEGIKDTYKIIYTGTFEGNGLTMSGIRLDTVTNKLATMGLFGKTEYATIRNINFEIENMNSTARYVGGITGIAINTSFVDVKVTGMDKTAITGANIVGGFAGLNIINDPTVENYNLYSSVSVTANFHNGQNDVGAALFSSGKEYMQQTLYATVVAFQTPYEQAFGTAGAVFGYITSNPNNYRVVDENGNSTIYAREFTYNAFKTEGGVITEQETKTSQNTEASWFLKDKAGNRIDDTVKNGRGLYYTSPIVLRNVSGKVKNVSANVAGGLVGILDETIELRRPNVISLDGLTGKYYLGGIVGINLGKISGGFVTDDDGITSTYTTLDTTNTSNRWSWSVTSSAGVNTYLFHNAKEEENATRVWGMTVGAVAGYTDGFSTNENSGVIENINVNVNVFTPSNSKLQYVTGGVVGALGDYGYINNAANLNTTVSNEAIRVDKTQAQNFGFYFGRIIGRSSTSSNSPTDNKTVRMKTMEIDIPHYGDNISYVSRTDFNTSNYIDDIQNAFGVTSDTKLKIQTMTLEEYRIYLAGTITDTTPSNPGTPTNPSNPSNPSTPDPETPDEEPETGYPSLNFTNKDLVTRFELLEPWLRILPTETTTEEIHGQLVWVEKFQEESLQEFKNWVVATKVFETWDNTHAALAGKAYPNYLSYLKYSAVSSKSVEDENETEFLKNLETYRKMRYGMGQVLFTYQYQLTTNAQRINGPQNANFTWDQYENYWVLVNNASAEYVSPTDSVYVNFVYDYNEALAKLVYPSSELAEYTAQGNQVMVDSHAVFLDLVAAAEKNNYYYTYKNTDPLQVYLNYVVQSNYENNPFQVNNNWKMSFAQYVYYMAHVYGVPQVFNGTTYGVPNNLTAIQERSGVPTYVSYWYFNASIGNSSDMLTIAEFIDMMIREQATVMANELIWIKTGHLVTSGVTNTTARISSIGAKEYWGINIKTSWGDAEKELVKTQSDVSITYKEYPAWDAMNQYTIAKASLGLNITKYKQIIGLGGSLYGLTQSGYTGSDATANYILKLQSEQYHWTDAQMKFISNYYKNSDSTIDVQYAVAATTYGNMVPYMLQGNIRAVYKTDAQMNENGKWYADNNGNEQLDAGEPTGIMTISGSTFTNGDGKTYTLVNGTIYLDENKDAGKGKVRGAAMYLDVNRDKLFNPTSGDSAAKDILLLYVVDSESDADFIFNRVYYKVARQILETNARTVTDSNKTDETGNKSDYLEEALWWRAQGFGANDFDRIKAHAMTKSVTAGFVTYSKNSNGNVEATRGSGYPLADDWKHGEYSGFAKDQFTATEYAEIVLGSDYVNGTWYSTYADYLLFKKMYNVDREGTTAINPTDITAQIPSTSKFNNPFDGTRDSTVFISKLAPEKDLANAIELKTERIAFMELLRSGHSTADYINWAQGYSDKNQYFRLNHYIYFVKEELNSDTFAAKDFRWTLTQSVRADIFYEGVTQESRTTDLVAFRRDWYNNGDPFMTFRDYCEWINIYYYAEEYRADRGDYEDQETGDKLTSTDGWLTIYAYAVWKRMEKYENNVEYLAKLGDSAGQDPITAPILKRKISTTVFPKLYSSGEQTYDSNGIVTDKHYVFPNQMKRLQASDVDDEDYQKDLEDEEGNQNLADEKQKFLAEYYGWSQKLPKKKIKYEQEMYPEYVWVPDIFGGHTETVLKTRDKIDEATGKPIPERDENGNIIYETDEDGNIIYETDSKGEVIYEEQLPEGRTMDPNHVRAFIDRYEYNERYTIMNIDRIPGTEDGNVGSNYASYFIKDAKFAKECDGDCGGKKDPSKCKDTTHAAYQMQQWTGRYGTGPLGMDEINAALGNTIFGQLFGQLLYASGGTYLRLDEVSLRRDSLDEDYKGSYAPIDSYVQLYIPFNRFKDACKQIKSSFSAYNNYIGYFNYMQFWAMNGEYDWICNTVEYSGPTDDVKIVKYPYTMASFWDNYQNTATISPLDGTTFANGKKANGF